MSQPNSTKVMIQAMTRTSQEGSSERFCGVGAVRVVEARATVTVRTPEVVWRLAVR